MVTHPAHHFEEIASSGGDSVTFHVEASDDPVGVAARARGAGWVSASRSTRARRQSSPPPSPRPPTPTSCSACRSGPGTRASRSCPRRSDARIARLSELVSCPIQVDGGVGEENDPPGCATPERACSSPAARSSPRRIQPRRIGGSSPPRRAMTVLERALELAERGRGTTHPNPSSAPSSYATARWWARAGTSAAGEPHAEVHALASRRRACPRRDALRHASSRARTMARLRPARTP